MQRHYVPKLYHFKVTKDFSEYWQSRLKKICVYLFVKIEPSKRSPAEFKTEKKKKKVNNTSEFYTAPYEMWTPLKIYQQYLQTLNNLLQILLT